LSAMPTRMVNICAKFHWNPPWHFVKSYRVTRSTC